MADPQALLPHVDPPTPRMVRRAGVRVRCAVPAASKVLPDIRAVVQACGSNDGATVTEAELPDWRRTLHERVVSTAVH